ncbi:hypothetical protein LR48_Vigan08g061100 [Vigna angularis]|uniref:Uncharacterized protein n=1 Tax=Phaseolus angularis TaxID=3914 RepID=A0A0L9V4Z9_PHAAN|nr:hypothetical protein LR48_Vigan08g061100 [Vigna angularis]
MHSKYCSTHYGAEHNLLSLHSDHKEKMASGQPLALAPPSATFEHVPRGKHQSRSAIYAGQRKEEWATKEHNKASAHQTPSWRICGSTCNDYTSTGVDDVVDEAGLEKLDKRDEE